MYKYGRIRALQIYNNTDVWKQSSIKTPVSQKHDTTA